MDVVEVSALALTQGSCVSIIVITINVDNLIDISDQGFSSQKQNIQNELE